MLANLNYHVYHNGAETNFGIACIFGILLMNSFRKAREAHLIHKAKTIEPLGIIKRDEL